MEDVWLVITLTYSVSLGFGLLLEKYLKMPWMFSSLFLGMIFSLFDIFQTTMETEVFNVFSRLGMFFLLFIIGFNLEIDKIKKFGRKIVEGALSIVGFEILCMGSLLYLGFPSEVSNSPLVAIITALSFATVGEAILLPILARFDIIGTKFGQLTLGIGTLDDILEVLTIVLIPFFPIFLPGTQIQKAPDPMLVLLDLISISILTLLLMKFAGKIRNVLGRAEGYEFLRPLSMLIVFFLFVTLGGFVFHSLAAVSAIFGGLVVRRLLPKEKLDMDEKRLTSWGTSSFLPFSS